MSKAPTMQTIAEAVGYSRMTVSLALRNSPNVAEETRKHIQKVATELGYSPNPLVSTLMAQRARKREDGGRIPLAVINTFEDFAKFQKIEFYSQVLAGIQKRATEHGFYGEIFHLGTSKGVTAAQLDRTLQARGIRGVIILPLADPESTFCLEWKHYSVAAVAHTWHGDPVHRAGVDLFGNARFLMENLYSLGFRRPGLFLRDYVHLRTRGTEAAAYYLFQKEHSDIAQLPLLLGNDSISIDEIRHWVEQHKPDVVIGHGNLLRTLNKLGSELCNSFAYAELNLMPSQFGAVGGVCPCPAVIGEQAVDLVVTRIYSNEFGLPDHPRMTMVSGTWHDGASLTKGVI